MDIIANHTTIGENVTTSKPEGPVVVKRGKMKINNAGNVTIESGFNVEKGAEFEITRTN